MPHKSPAAKKMVAKPKNVGYDVTGVAIVDAPMFVGGMTEQQAIAYIGEKIRMHREMGRKVAWTEEDIYIRHQLIINWLSQGRPGVDVARDIRNLWGVVDSTSRLYISEALEYLTKATDEYRDKQRELQVARLEKYMEECRLTGKYMEAAKFAEQIAKITGTYQDNKKIEIKSEQPISITFGE